MPAATAFANIGWKYYLIFIIVPIVGLPVLFYFPETKGLSLEEIAAVFGDEVALDLTHLTTHEKAELDKKIRASDKTDIQILQENNASEEKVAYNAAETEENIAAKV